MEVEFEIAVLSFETKCNSNVMPICDAISEVVRSLDNEWNTYTYPLYTDTCVSYILLSSLTYIYIYISMNHTIMVQWKLGTSKMIFLWKLGSFQVFNHDIY